ncbi:hypothetical protein TNCV_2855071 [Trichonephila clavipes]|nr:hypothetical protein TNCV_2855071 [Trichonephila clavipes]
MKASLRNLQGKKTTDEQDAILTEHIFNEHQQRISDYERLLTSRVSQNAKTPEIKTGPPGSGDSPLTGSPQLTGRITNEPLPVFLITLPRNIDNAKIFKVDKIAPMTVTVEGYENKGITHNATNVRNLIIRQAIAISNPDA